VEEEILDRCIEGSEMLLIWADRHNYKQCRSLLNRPNLRLLLGRIFMSRVPLSLKTSIHLDA